VEREGQDVADEKDVEPAEESGGSSLSGKRSPDLDDPDALEALYNASAAEEEGEAEHPVDHNGDTPSTGSDDSLVSVGAPRRRTSQGSSAPGGVVKAARGPKGQPTPSRRGGVAKPARTGPITFIRESIGELRKVVYPTGPQVIQYFVVVLVFVLFVIAYVSLLDLGLGAALFKIFS
jgi:preprotein translocase subunit SecE